MANRDGREVLRGSEVETFDSFAEVFTAKQWADLHVLVETLLELLELAGAGSIALAHGDGREAFRGVEVVALDVIAEVVTSQQWKELLEDPLEYTVGQGDRDLAQKLMRAGAEIGDALHTAVNGGYGDIVNDLLDGGAPIDDNCVEDRSTPLHLAAKVGKTEMVQLLLLRGAKKNEPNLDRHTPLFVAVLGGHVSAALALLAAGAGVHFRCGYEKVFVTHEAARKGNVVVLRALIEHGVDVNAGDRYNNTPLHSAPEGNKEETIDVLVEAGADIDAMNRDGRTPLICAAINYRTETVLALLRHGANINLADLYDRTPLWWTAAFAGEQGASEMVDLLLRSGADETKSNDEGETPENVIGRSVNGGEQGRKDVRRLLENARTDRVWRRRGYLVLCRAHPDRVRLGQESEGDIVDMAGRTGRGPKLARAEGSGDNGMEAGGTVAGDRTGGDWAGVFAGVVGLQEEGIFRTIVGYL